MLAQPAVQIGEAAYTALGGIVGADLQRLEEFHVLRIELELGDPGAGGDSGPAARRLLVLLVESNGGFQDQEDIVSPSLNPGDNVGDLLRFGERLADGIAQFLDQFLKLLVHTTPGCAPSHPATRIAPLHSMPEMGFEFRS